MVSFETQRALTSALASNDMDWAGTLAESALGRGESHAMLYTLAGMRRQRTGDTHGAVTLLKQAAVLEPNDPGVLTAAADALRYTGQLRESLHIFDRALAIDPMQVAAWYGRAQALDGAGDIEGARGAYARVAQLAPHTTPGHAGLAAMLALLGETDEARASAARALALSPSDPVTHIALARCDLEDGEPDAAIARLRTLTARHDLLGHDRVVALSLLGDALDRKGDTHEAFKAYEATNLHFAEMHAGPNAPPVALHLVEALEEAVGKLDTETFRGVAPAVPGEAERHIFLLGYPRSGTTLVEQVLATAPGVETLEEEPTLAAAAAYLIPERLPQLGDLDAGQAAQLRGAYWQAVRDAGSEVAGKTFVDMDPLKGLHLPLIARLFPEAKVVVMRRDPRDVVWSCFRRTFVYNPVTYEFSSLMRVARHYDAVMRLMERCLDTLPLNFITMRYVDLINDFDGETKRLCDFAGLPWSEDMRRFDRTATNRPVKTRSATQVRRGLFDGTGQWRRYARELEPVLPILQPWVEKFAFAD